MHQSSSLQDFKSNLESTHQTVSIIPAVPVQKDDNSKSNNPPPAASAASTTNSATTTPVNTTVGSVIRNTMNAATNHVPATVTNNVTTGTGTSSLGQKRTAATAFQESITHPSSSSSSSFPNLLSSSFHLPFQTTLSNLGTTGSSTGSDYSGNDESYTIAPQPQQSIACSNTTAVTDGTCGLASGATTTTSAQIDLTPINRNGKNLTEKKIRRLEKNRLSARNCRRKKKEYTLNLQREIMMLEGENLRLRLQLQIGQEAEQSTIKEQEKVTEGIDELLKSGAPDSEIYNSIEMFQARFADYGRDRRSAIEFHLRNVERLLMPTTTTSVAMRALQGGSVSGSGGGNGSSGETEHYSNGNNVEDPRIETGSVEQCDRQLAVKNTMEIDSQVANTTVEEKTQLVEKQNEEEEEEEEKRDDYQVPKDINSDSCKLENPEPKELFKYLVKFLEVTPEQATALKDSRHVAKELDSALEKSLSMLRELRERLYDMGQDLDAEFTAIRSILTPRQAAKFLVWVANNGACMSMLNELWSKVYPEPVVVGNNDDDDDDDNE